MGEEGDRGKNLLIRVIPTDVREEETAATMLAPELVL
jgi:hypothetical protein